LLDGIPKGHKDNTSSGSRDESVCCLNYAEKTNVPQTADVVFKKSDCYVGYNFEREHEASLFF